MAESEAQSSICDYLAIRKHLFWRNNNTPIFDAARNRYRAMPKHTMRGLPDIIVIRDGMFIGLEVKQTGKYQSKEQKAFEALCKAHGAAYHVVRSIDDVQQIGL